jgi:hypothetical protein
MVRASGSYDFNTEFVIRRQSMEGVPAVRVVTPLRPATGDTAVLVIRGIVPSPDANTVELDSLAGAGPQRVEGIALAISTEPGGGEPLETNGRTTWDGWISQLSGRRCPSLSAAWRSCNAPTRSCPPSSSHRTRSTRRRAAPELRGTVVRVRLDCCGRRSVSHEEEGLRTEGTRE